ncbi:hypothetical protein CDO52_23925 [Nocardiopsis gilva YIM 90087]|uniref:Uncharacterized protein n=1 Tax=Nocardiopsis gilva YIM 90087 TaxID=1235441 RepID=A0A223SBG8_9ACTN|nr:hypothetical protein [Nocardiopsis gilva]ASU85442.1 hypothetical protein CDO52_23925 [Nocardiopsis gilva YIM 90087]
MAWLQMLALCHLRGPVRAARTVHRHASRLMRRVRRGIIHLDRFFARFRARSDHLSILDGQTLNLSAVLPRPGGGAVSVHIEFEAGGRRVAALTRVLPDPDGRDRVEATVRLRPDHGSAGIAAPPGAADPRSGGGPARETDPAEVRLAAGRWRVRLVAVYPEETLRVALTLPRATGAAQDRPAGQARACPQTRARFALVGTATGAAALSVAPPRAAAEVRSVLVRPTRARVTGELLDLPDIHAMDADVALRGGGSAHKVRLEVQPGSRGIAFTVDLPVPELAEVARSELRWELRFHTRSHGTLRAGRPDTDLRSAGAVLRVPAQTVFPETGPPVLLRPYYTDAGTLTIALTPLPQGVRP